VIGATIETSGNWLSIRYESIEQISYVHVDYINSAENFRQFLAKFGIRYLIIPTAEEESRRNINTAPTPPGVLEAAEQLQHVAGVRTIVDRRHILFDLSALSINEIRG